MATLGAIGFGRVGEATLNIFRDDHRIRWYDKYRNAGPEGKRPLDAVVKESDILFVSLPTPADFSGLAIDLSIIDESIEKIAVAADGEDKTVVIKSTVVPGTTLRYQEQYPQLSFCMSPEFLRDKTYIQDALNPDKIVVGSNRKRALDEVSYLFANRFPEVPIFQTNPTTAEFIKYSSNILLFANVAIANLLYDCAMVASDNFEPVNYNEEIVPALLTDSRQSTHIRVDETNRGSGGKCFPKDLVAMIGWLGQHDDPRGKGAQEMFHKLWEYNLKVRKIHDWEEIAGAVSGKVDELYRKQEIQG